MPEWQEVLEALYLMDEGFAPSLADQMEMPENQLPVQVDEDDEFTYWDVYAVYRRVAIPKHGEE